MNKETPVHILPYIHTLNYLIGQVISTKGEEASFIIFYEDVFGRVITTIEDRTVVAYGCRRTKKLNDGPVADTYGYTFNADIFLKPVFFSSYKM